MLFIKGKVLTLNPCEDVSFCILEFGFTPARYNEAHCISCGFVTDHMNTQYGVILFQSLSYIIILN